VSQQAVAYAYIDQISVREVPNWYRALLGMWRSGVVYTLIVTERLLAVTAFAPKGGALCVHGPIPRRVPYDAM
jgi:hypothetical protein